MSHAIRNAARFNRIVSKLAAFGLQHVLHKANLTRAKPKAGAKPEPQRLRELFEDLGGAFPKLGQLLSLRPDLIPQAYSEALEGLQDEMKPFSAKEAKQILEAELKTSISKVFKKFEDRPIAAASIGQVHKAVLHDGTIVAVKIQRPRIKEIIDSDIDILTNIAHAIKPHVPANIADPEQIVREFKEYTENELDYTREARTINKFAKDYQGRPVIIPTAIEKYCTSKIIVMTFVQGIRVTSIKEPRTRKLAAHELLHAELQGIFLDGLFHADPHPGNVLWHDGKIVLLDFGIIGTLSDTNRENLGRVLVSLLTKDVDELVTALYDLGFITQDTNKEAFSQDIRATLGPYYDAPLGDMKLGTMLREVLETARRNQATIPKHYVLLMKTVVTVESTCALLDKKFKFTTEAHPFIKEMIEKHANPAALIERMTSSAKRWKRFLKSFPEHADQFFQIAEQGERAVVRLDQDLSYLTNEIHIVSGRLVFGVLAGAFVVAGALVSRTGPEGPWGISVPAIVCFAITAILLIAILISMFNEKHRR